MRGVIDEFADSAIGAASAPVYERIAEHADTAAKAAHHRRASAGYVRLEIRTDTLYGLINDKTLVIEDLRGLDQQAKSWIRKRLLETLLL